MKKLHLLFYALTCISVVSCRYFNDHDIHIGYSEDDQYYSMNAHFPSNRTRDVEEYLDRRIGNNSNMSFKNTRIDGKVTLDDHTTFYIKKFPGILKIKLDKDKNSEESYHEIKTMCQGIKRILVK